MFMEFIKQAKFICAESEWGSASPLFKKAFVAEKGVKRAELQISSLGVYTAYLNGERQAPKSTKN